MFPLLFFLFLKERDSCMRYDFLLFDADDTLLDFGAEEKIAFRATFESYGYAYDEAVMLPAYNTINHRLWGAFEKGEIQKQEIIDRRFKELFEHLGIKGDAAAFSRDYQDNLGKLGGVPEPGAVQAVKELQGKARLFVVTNGIKETQEQRMQRSGLAPFFENMFISDVLGVRKPQKEYFDIVFSEISGFDPSRALLIGDSLTSDMAGGENAGIDTCWYNKQREKKPAGISVTYEIHTLTDVLPIAFGTGRAGIAQREKRAYNK